MALLFLYALLAAVPEEAAVTSEQAGERLLRAGHYEQAAPVFARVLREAPSSLDARAGLACAYLLSGHGARATLELTMGLERGMSPGHLGDCAGHSNLDGEFLVAKLGLTQAFAVPRIAGARSMEAQLTAEPSLSSADDSRRLLIGACLAYRAGFAGAGWYYAANAVDRGGVRRAEAAMFLDCAHGRILAASGCRSSKALSACLGSETLRATYLADRPYLYPADSPAAYAGSR
jgi:hypothetical protein